ncbi:alpha/beta fold hydrolase [Rhodocytophaga aerolata]|uniref:Alpha/beta fold hydrolase n=1 Tax=Rhodocytophaga aerolata TaxID=455078 RepID=A0ABT8QZ50_9BACT|nr:alpha/beta fold hydrolase [Rhodocytophaga aerolata]MDO1445116.1 alpha/beta fold hydrolase [Rhodocytophaga aerolata]
MHRLEHTFSYRGAHLHYSCIGTGNKILLAFHGYGQSNLHYRHMAEQLSGHYTVYAFDLFFHGKSIWHLKDHPLTKEFLGKLMQTFLQEKQIDRFSVMGFSMGGKWVLALLEQFPQQIDELILIAPDGVKTSFWYNLATYPGWTKNHFRKVAISPTYFQTLAHTFRKLHLVDKGVVRFAQHQMNTRQKRLRVYYSWMVFRELTFNMTHIASLLTAYQIPVTMFLGIYDRIITKKNMEVLLSKLPKHRLILLETGHNQLLEEVAAYYAKYGIPEKAEK